MFAHAVNKSAALQQGCGIQDRQEKLGDGALFVFYTRQVGVNDKERGVLSLSLR